MFYGILIIFVLSKALKSSCSMWYKQFESRFTWRCHRWYHNIEVANTFKSKYGSISIFICRILPCDFNWYVTQVYIREVNNTLKTKCSQSCFTFICPDSNWTFSNGSLDSDLFYLDNVHLVKNGNLKLAEPTLSFINNFDNIKHNNHIQFNKSYGMAVLFK